MTAKQPRSVTPPPPRPEPPEKPLPTDCCGGGCPVCVLDIYERELAEYEQSLAAWKAAQDAAD